jgi:hypothetical protein
MVVVALFGFVLAARKHVLQAQLLEEGASKVKLLVRNTSVLPVS